MVINCRALIREEQIKQVKKMFHAFRDQINTNTTARGYGRCFAVLLSAAAIEAASSANLADKSTLLSATNDCS